MERLDHLEAGQLNRHNHAKLNLPLPKFKRYTLRRPTSEAAMAWGTGETKLQSNGTSRVFRRFFEWRISGLCTLLPTAAAAPGCTMHQTDGAAGLDLTHVPRNGLDLSDFVPRSDSVSASCNFWRNAWKNCLALHRRSGVSSGLTEPSDERRGFEKERHSGWLLAAL